MAETDFQLRSTRSPRFSTSRAPGFLGGGLSTTGTRPVEEDQPVVPPVAPGPTKGSGTIALGGNDGGFGNTGFGDQSDDGRGPASGGLGDTGAVAGPTDNAAANTNGIGIEVGDEIGFDFDISNEDIGEVSGGFLGGILGAPLGPLGQKAVGFGLSKLGGFIGSQFDPAKGPVETDLSAQEDTGFVDGLMGFENTGITGPHSLANETNNPSNPSGAPTGGGSGGKSEAPGSVSSTESAVNAGFGDETGEFGNLGPQGQGDGTGHVGGLGETGNAGNASAGNPDGGKGSQGNAPGSRGENDAEHGGGNAGGGTDTRVVCTELHRKGLMSRADYVRDLRFTRDHLTDTHVKGYHIWALPTVRAMRRSKTATAVWRFIGQARANQIAYVCGERDRPDWAGRIIRAIGEPLCYVLGVLAEKTGREVDYKTLYTEKNNAG